MPPLACSGCTSRPQPSATRTRGSSSGGWSRSASPSTASGEIDPVAYAAALGERGLSAYRREVDRRLEADPEDFYPRRARQRLAVHDRDIPAIVIMVGRDLDRPHHFAALVDALIEIDARDEALDYALRGVTVAPVAHQTVPLYDAAARLLTERGDSDQALRLRRQQLATFPDERSYGSLRRSAQDSGVWEVERLAALDVLLEHNPSAWLRTLLAEGETDLAWDASRSMDLDAVLDLQLLRERARTRPGDVVDGYASQIRETLGPADQQAYRKGVALLGELRRAAVSAGRAGDHEALVAELLETHRRRPPVRHAAAHARRLTGPLSLTRTPAASATAFRAGDERRSEVPCGLSWQVRPDVLDEVDGWMLKGGIQDVHNKSLEVVPSSKSARPDRGRLEERYALFLAS